MDSADEDEHNHFETMSDESVLTSMSRFFDEPVWRKVLEKLKKKDDIENCSNASPFFGYSLFEQRERKVVLPQVFGILAQRFSNRKNKDESYKETNLESIPWKRPSDSENPDEMTGIWKCRLVCKKWNEAIEEVHRNENAGHYQMTDDFDKAEIHQLASKGLYISKCVETDVQFLLDFGQTRSDGVQGGISVKCPFLSRAVRMDYGCDDYEDENQAHFHRFIEMLAKFGGEVWYFEFWFWHHGSIEQYIQLYQKLKKIAELLPNLKVLRLKYWHSDFFSHEHELEALGGELERNPFPQLANLEMILVFRIPGTLCNHLVTRNPQISRLELADIRFRDNCTLFMNNFPNLSQLSLHVNELQVFEAFENYQGTLKLKKFFFEYRLCQFLPWSRVFNAIQSKLDEDSCIDLKLCMPYPSTNFEKLLVLEETLNERLSFTKIERISVNGSCRFCLDFLLPSKNSLGEITLSYSLIKCLADTKEIGNLRGKQVIKFFGFEDKMHESNIARVFRRLKNVTINSKSGAYKLYSIQPNGQLNAGQYMHDE